MAVLPTRGEYPKDWPSIARAVKDEACWRCVRCGTAHCVATGHVLTVHHFDGDKANCARWNLMALCQRCHLSVQARVDPEVPLMFPPAVWAMPYIAGFYEAGRGVPGPLYDLAGWVEQYGPEAWPAWAPQPEGVMG
ncbi:MAG: HNH endonuclease signature motif containing protein [Planctomycetota bacterium]